MKKVIIVFSLILLFITPLFSQQDQLSFLNETQVGNFMQPFATSLSEGLNSGSFYTASISSFPSFSISFRGMIMFVPSSQMTFTPTLPSGYKATNSTATIWGDQGTIYTGPNGYIPYPNGLNQSNIPFAMPQITGSFMGTEVLIRYLPTVHVKNDDINYFGIGVRHSISQYIPLIPVDVAVGVLYNKLNYGSYISGSTFAVNGEVSKTFGLFTAYGGLQYESSSFDLSYTIKGDPNNGDPTLRQDRNISASVSGADNIRFILGGSLKIGFLVINADYNLASQSLFSGGLSFEF